MLTPSLATDSVFARPGANGGRDQVGEASRLRDQVAHLTAGDLVEVRLVNREKIHGRLGVVESDGFALDLEDRTASQRRIAFADVLSPSS